MAGNQVAGDGLSMNLAGMSKNQLYDIMSQMKTLIEQNQDQARQILIRNPLLTKALFQAQIMLGMLQPPQEIPDIQLAGSQNPQQAIPPAQLPSAQITPLTGQNSLRDQPSAPMPSSSIPPSNPSLPSHPLQHSRSHMSSQSAPPVPPPQSSNTAALLPHYPTQPPPSVIQPTMPPASTAPLQQPLHISTMPHLPLQPPLPPQPRPPSMPAFPHQNYPHMRPGGGFQHPGAPQLQHSQPMFHSGSRPPTSISAPFSQGQPPLPNQQVSQTLYQGGGSHLGMEFTQTGIQPERGSNPGGPPFLPPHMTSVASQPPRPPATALTADMEKALLQQVMSLTPEQINLLPPDQRTQVLQLQQMLRQ